MNWFGLIQACVGIASVVLLVAFSTLGVRASVYKQRIEGLRTDLDDYKRRDEIKDHRINELESENRQSKLDIVQLQEKVQHLTELVTQKAKVEEVSTKADTILKVVANVKESVDALASA